MIPEWITVIFNLLRPGRILYFAGTLATALCLFLPDNQLEFLGLKKWVTTYRGYFGLGFVVFGSLSAVYAAKAIGPAIWKRILARWKIESFKRTFRALTVREKTVLVWCVEKHARNFRAPRDSKTVQSLIDKRIVTAQRHGWQYTVDWDAWIPMESFREEVRESIGADDPDARDIWKMLEKASTNRI